MINNAIQAQPFPYQPFSKKQQKVLTWWLPNSPCFDQDMIIADGSIRSGKTVSMTESFLLWSLGNFKNSDFILSGKSSGALERNVLRPGFQMLAAKNIPYNYIRGANKVLQIGTNNYYCFGGNDERSQDFVQGMTGAGALFDEVALMPESFVNQCIARCSVPGSRFWFNCNPENPMHFFKKDFIDKAALKHALYIHFTMADNLSLTKEIRERYERMYTGVYYKRYIKGIWVIAEGAIYKDSWADDLIFNDATASPTLKNSLMLSRYILVDYGTTNPQVYLDVYDDGEILHQVKEYYWDSKTEGRQKTDAQYADDLEEFIGENKDACVIVPPEAASFKAELSQRGIYHIDADNEVLDGIRAVSVMFSTKRYWVHESCVHTIEEIQSYAWNDKKATDHGVEEPIKKGDHTPDAIRYGIKTKVPAWRLAT